jgi:EAL and modified HD-GYP domain-containing signal transduction protein
MDADRNRKRDGRVRRYLRDEIHPMSGPQLARQPIVNRHRQVHAFEVLFRKDAAADRCDTGGDQATAGVILRALMGLGIQRITDGRPAFINVTERLLDVDGLEFILPPDLVVLEILESVERSTRLVRRLQELREVGFRIALDDYVHRPGSEQLLEIADYVKVDVRALDASEVQRHARLKKASRASFVAEKVEAYDEFRRCVDLGFDLFQGWFFCKPETMAGSQANANRMTAIQVIARLHQADVPIDEVTRLVTLDPALSYCVMRVANSTLYSRPVEVESIHDGVMRLGVVGLRRWISVMLMAGLEDKPRELFMTALLRARMCELLALERSADPDIAFTIGLFSVLDAMFDRPLDQVLAELPVSKQIRDALLFRGGDAGAILRVVLAQDQGQWEATDPVVTQQWLQALDWSRSMLDALGLRAPANVGARRRPTSTVIAPD